MKKILLLLVSIMLLFSLCSCAATDIETARNGTVMVIAANEVDFSTGSGFFVGKPGSPAKYVVTNAHVISNMTGYAALLDDKDITRFPLRLVDIDIKKDIAILKLDSSTKLRENLSLCVSENVNSTQSVYAIGYPGAVYQAEGALLGGIEDSTVTKGIISKTMQHNGCSYYQIDAGISPGNSGGPLVTEQGNVIGINSMSNNLAVGINYAICIDELIPMLERNDIPYELKKDVNSTPIIIIAAVALLLAIGAGIFLLIKKKSGIAAKPKQYFIYGLGGYYSGSRFELNGKTLSMGRDPSCCNIVFPQETKGVSALHCQVSASADKLYVTDLGSRYGTFLANGELLITGKAYAVSLGESFYLCDPVNTFEWRGE